MNIVIPTDSDAGLSALRGAHFGRAPFYTVVKCESGNIISTESIKNLGHAQGGCSIAVNNIKKLQADILIVIGIGATPLQQFQKNGINVYRDGESQTVESCITKHLSQSLPPMSLEDSCSH